MSRSGSRAWIAGAVFLLVAGGLGWLTWSLVKRSGQRHTADVIALEPGHVGAFLNEFPPAVPLPLAQDPGPTLLSLRLDKATPRQAIEALAQASGSKLQPFQANLWDRIENKQVTVSLDRRPFWEAMSAVCRQAGLWPQLGSSTLLNTDGLRRGDCPSVVSGSFLVTAFLIQHTASVDAADSATAHAIRVEMMLMAEPKLSQRLASGTRATIEEAVDEAGHSLLDNVRPARMAQVLGQPSPSRGIGWFQVFLSCPEKPGKRIAKLKGYASARIEKVQTFEVADLSKPGQVISTPDGYKFQFKQIANEQGRSGVDLELTGQSGQSFQQLMQRFHTPSALVKVLDAKGNELYGGGWGSAGATMGAYLPRVFFDPGNSKPAKVILNVPMELSEMQVPFEFKDLPLP
jgi:hypothetical protein